MLSLLTVIDRGGKQWVTGLKSYTTEMGSRKKNKRQKVESGNEEEKGLEGELKEEIHEGEDTLMDLDMAEAEDEDEEEE